MLVTPIKTTIIQPGDSLTQLILKYLPQIPPRSVLAIASKAFSFSENRLIPKITGSRKEKAALVIKEAEWYTDPILSQYYLISTIKRNLLFLFAGVDESNSKQHYSLWPKNPQTSVNRIWQFVCRHYGIKEFGVIMTDSAALPLIWGQFGACLAHCGFSALNDYRGQKDLFGREFIMERQSVTQSLAAAAAFEMGEGAESQPLCLITDIHQSITFQDHIPTQSELDQLKVKLADDAFAPLFQNAPFKKGGSYQNST